MITFPSNQKNGCCGFAAEDWDLKWKPTTTHFGWVFHLNVSLAILCGNHYKQIHKNGYHSSTVKDRDLMQKTNTITYGSIFSLNMLLAIFDGNLICVV